MALNPCPDGAFDRTQLLTIREFLTQFNGNEIIISLVIFCWLLMTGIGALTAKFVKGGGLKVYAPLILIIAIWPLLQIIGIRGFREFFFIHGVSPGFYPILFYILITITPYCLLTGFVLPYSQNVLNISHYPFESGDLYITDSIGDIAGGAIFSFILVYLLKPFPIIAITSSLLILVALLILVKQRQYVLLAGALIVCSGFYLFSTNNRFETFTLSGQYGDIVHSVWKDRYNKGRAPTYLLGIRSPSLFRFKYHQQRGEGALSFIPVRPGRDPDAGFRRFG